MPAVRTTAQPPSHGLQYEDVARDTNRGHTVAAVAECFQLAKNAGFKVGELASKRCTGRDSRASVQAVSKQQLLPPRALAAVLPSWPALSCDGQGMRCTSLLGGLMGRCALECC